MIKNIGAVVLATVMSFAVPVYAQAVNPPGAIDLTQQILDHDGNPILNFDDRKLGIRVLEAIRDGDFEVAKGEVITDREKTRRVMAYMEAKQLKFAVQDADPDCAECSHVTLGYVLSQAYLTKVCQPVGMGQPKAPECTADEEKAENNPMRMLGRQDKAKEILESEKSGASVTLNRKATDELKNLIAARFKNAPIVVARAWMMIDPLEKPIAPGAE